MAKVLILDVCRDTKTYCSWCHKAIGQGEQMIVEQIVRAGSLNFHTCPCMFEKLGYQIKKWY